MIERLGNIVVATELAVIIVLLFMRELKDNSNNYDGDYGNSNSNSNDSHKHYKKYIEWDN